MTKSECTVSGQNTVCIYHTIDFDPNYWLQTKYCMQLKLQLALMTKYFMQQMVARITAGCNTSIL